MKQLLNFLDKNFGYLLLLLICGIKFFLGHLRNEAIFIIIALCILGAALFYLIVVFIMSMIIKSKYKQDADDWIKQQQDKRPTPVLKALFSDIGIVPVIIVWNGLSFYLIIYLLNWPQTFLFVSFAILFTQVKKYLRAKKIPDDPIIDL